MKYTVEVTKDHTKWFKEGTDILHREDGPASFFSDGEKHWIIDGKFHREDGPAIEFASGNKHWYLNGLSHREDGPACIHTNGYKAWFLHGKRHREDGPAIEWVNLTKSWYLNGIEIKCTTQEEFLYRTQTGPLKGWDKDHCDGKVVEIDGKKYKLVGL